MGVSYADKFISFEGALTDRDIKTLVSESRSDTILQTNYMPLDTATLQELNRIYFANFRDAILRIYCSHGCDIKAIECMSEVRHLIIESSTEILNLDVLYELNNLRSLCIEARRFLTRIF